MTLFHVKLSFIESLWAGLEFNKSDFIILDYSVCDSQLLPPKISDFLSKEFIFGFQKSFVSPKT